MTRIDTIIRRRGITQVEPARLPRGNFREHSLERRLRLLTASGRDIDIVRQAHSPAAAGTPRIAAAESA